MKVSFLRMIKVRIIPQILLRSTVLLLILGALKMALLLSASDYLIEEHWRYATGHQGVAARIGLILVVLLLFISALKISFSLRHLDRLRAHVLGVIAVLFLVCFHISSSGTLRDSYINAWIHKLITVADIRAYLFVACTDGPLYLGVLVVIMAMGWYVLTRRRMDYGVPTLAAALAGIYLLLRFWNNPPALEQSTALIALGIVGLLTGAVGKKSLAQGKVFPRQPEVASCFFLIFSIAASICFIPVWIKLCSLPFEFTLLFMQIVMAVAGSFLLWYLVGRKDAIKLVPLLPFFAAGYFLYGNWGYFEASNWSHQITCFLNQGGYWAGELVITVFLAFITWLIACRSVRAAVIVFDVFATVIIGLTAVDVMVFRLLGIRLDWDLLTIGDDFKLVWGVVAEFVTPGRIAFIVIVFAGYFLAVYFLPKLKIRDKLSGVPYFRSEAFRKQWARMIFYLVCIIFAGSILQKKDKISGQTSWKIIKSSTFVKQFSRHRFKREKLLAEGKALGVLPPHPQSVMGKSKDWNVVLVILESMHCRYLSLFGGDDETQPLMSAYADRMHIFPNFYSVFPNSNHARFAIFNGLYPPQEYISYVNPRIPCPSLSEILCDAGWITSMFYASHRNYTRQWDYWKHRKWTQFYDASNMPHADEYARVSWGVKEEAVLEAMKDELKARAADGKKFLLTYIPAAPHRPFDGNSTQFKKFDEGTWGANANYVGQYKNQLLRMDWILDSLIKELKACELLDRTLVVITDDHGEFLGEDNGKIGHGWDVDPSESRIPLIIMRPDMPNSRIIPTLGSQVDILPTIMDILRLPLPAGHFYQGRSLYDPLLTHDVDCSGQSISESSPRVPGENCRSASLANRSVYLRSNKEQAWIAGDYFFLSAGDGSQAVSSMRMEPDGANTQFIPIPNDQITIKPEEIIERLKRFQKFQDSLIYYYRSYIN